MGRRTPYKGYEFTGNRTRWVIGRRGRKNATRKLPASRKKSVPLVDWNKQLRSAQNKVTVKRLVRRALPYAAAKVLTTVVNEIMRDKQKFKHKVQNRYDPGTPEEGEDMRRRKWYPRRRRRWQTGRRAYGNKRRRRFNLKRRY